MRKRAFSLSICLFVLVFLISTGTYGLIEHASRERLQTQVISSDIYREQNLGEDMVTFLRQSEEPGEHVAVYLLETHFGYETWKKAYKEQAFRRARDKWQQEKSWASYLQATQSIWDDVKYFPVPELAAEKNLTVSYENSWLSERTYGGKRGHEGTDIMASENVRGLYPVLSITDGVVTKKGWLDKGGCRVGIETAQGAYFYYAHLDSYADIEIGDEIRAGDLLGYMGDSGYGPEGTVGQFPVHLHLGIYLYPDGKEVSINPYWVLRYIENRKVKCYTEM